MIDFELNELYFYDTIINGIGDLTINEFGTGTIGKRAIHITDESHFHVWFIMDGFIAATGPVYQCVYKTPA